MNLSSLSSAPRLSVFLLLLAYGGSAAAHPGHNDGMLAGLLHPLTGIDHILAMLAVGLWSTQLGGRAQWLLPASFIVMLAVGGAVGATGGAMPMIETGIVTSVLLLGVLVGFAVKLPLAPAALLVAVFAWCHGYAHGTEMPAMASGWLYGAGFVAASAALHGLGLTLGNRVAPRSGWLRSGGAAISLAGVWLGMAA